MITVGIDIGSLSTKSAILNDKKEILAYDVVFTGGNNRQSAEITFNNVLKKAGLNKSEIDLVVTTGYGRENVPFSDKHVSEITCHAKGIHLLKPHIRTILDIGGQDSKAILIDKDGNVINFMMNDKCAAGCGRFLEIISKALNVKLEDLGDISMQATSAARISSMCTVFAETEVVSLVAVGTPIPNIVKGVHESIVSRATSLLKTVGITEPVAMSGGVAKNKGIIKSLEDMLNMTVEVTDYPQVMGAIGAAFIGQLIGK
ncbi:acyl-CoA dehydratase activase [Paramaledivibacter caminithermalis]|jgi:predicted CoA-substrate-specific enzyme activase|uniref:Benzoyl-CoA reductase, bcr type, subunit A/benzoyl-CoA reductase, bcr type, subunit D,TIGR02261 n=1 Tax=Paramaledivibacter caminithermalis (strain DSM 15212 / CIP 107654 / DViRD3) TaxID=1121301 RepID=A0A1M6QRN5_PARC5|nr:acyl-CoA dehydratase activase [Paramaledivibacter caminithermalis]SHK22884.1 benzoyl-CoA reductase, bcr type, subunit A/benzoyl-CoA reductase, bcr type, subunit D,TIGR02261 [Paramaledivibacter caminithermalis DSM 15212]